MEFKAKQIAELIGGKIEGDDEIAVSQVVKIDEEVDGGLSFLANPKYEQFIYTTRADVIIVNNDFIPEKKIGATLIRVESPYLAIASLLEMYNKMKLEKSGISQQASIDDSAQIGEDAYIGDFAFIGKNVVLGKGARIYPHAYIGDHSKIGDGSTVFAGARLYHDTILRNDCTIHSGVIIGSDGFGFSPNEDGE